MISLDEYTTSKMNEVDVSSMQLVTYDMKAFDRLRHDIILKRLLDCRFEFGIILWIRSYLNGRTQFVKIKNVQSKSRTVYSGVPQGSMIDPYLFTLVVDSFAISNERCMFLNMLIILPCVLLS